MPGFLRGLKQTRIYRTPEPDGRDAPASSTQFADYHTVDAAASRPTLDVINPAVKIRASQQRVAGEPIKLRRGEGVRRASYWERAR